MLLEEETPGPVTAVDTEIIDPNTIAAAAAANSGITDTTGLYDESNSPTPIVTINPTQPTPDTEPNSTLEAKPDYEDDEDYAGDNDKVEEVEPSEEDIPDTILIESGEIYIND